jgi:citrate synthase
MAGWCAHVLEQAQENRLIRPQATYVGPNVHPFEPINHRTGMPPKTLLTNGVHR